MGIEIDKQIILNTLSTDTKEAMELLSKEFYIYIVFVILAIYFLNRFILKNLKKENLKKYFLMIFLLISIFVLITKIDDDKYHFIIKNDTGKVVPLCTIRATLNYLRIKNRVKKIEKKDISNEFTYQKRKSPIIVVVIIGESARSDRFSINGYQKETTPDLEKLNNLFSYKNAYSCDTSTLSSVPCMITRFKKSDFSFPIKEVSFVKIFKNHGFDTYWLTLEHEVELIHNFCKEANECDDYSFKKYDTDLLVRYNQIVKNVKKDTLIVLHTLGSHYEYDNRVPPKYRKFKPICDGKTSDKCPKNRLDNSYDNTIYFTNIFISNAIDSIKNKKSFMIYASDHGESLGESILGFKKFGHASPYNVAPSSQIHIPFIVWFSDKFLSEKSIKIDINKKISHDYFFHSILGCAGFEGKLLDNSLNICHY